MDYNKPLYREKRMSTIPPPSSFPPPEQPIIPPEEYSIGDEENIETPPQTALVGEQKTTGAGLEKTSPSANGHNIHETVAHRSVHQQVASFPLQPAKTWNEFAKINHLSRDDREKIFTLTTREGKEIRKTIVQTISHLPETSFQDLCSYLESLKQKNLPITTDNICHEAHVQTALKSIPSPYRIFFKTALTMEEQTVLFGSPPSSTGSESSPEPVANSFRNAKNVSTLFTACVNMKMRQIPITRENLLTIQELEKEKTNKKTTVNPKLGLGRRVLHYLYSFLFKGGLRAIISTKLSQRKSRNPQGSLPQKYLTYTRSMGGGAALNALDPTFQLAMPISSSSTEENVLNLQEAATHFQRPGDSLTQVSVAAEMQRLQNLAQAKGMCFEYETNGICSLSDPTPPSVTPFALLDPAKILHCKQQAAEGKPSRYLIPYVLPGYIGHYVTIALDFNNKQVCFFDSKGQSIDDAQSAYSIGLRFNLREEMTKMGELCFSDRNAEGAITTKWSSTEGSLVESRYKLQKDAHRCGKYGCLFASRLVQSSKKSFQEIITELNEDQNSNPSLVDDYSSNVSRLLYDNTVIGRFQRTLGERLNNVLPLKPPETHKIESRTA